MVQIARLIGGAGTGKTTELLNIIDSVVKRGIDPLSIGFCSFTRAARAEAVSRVSDRFGISGDEITRFGWFKTIHSVAYRQLGVSGELLTGNKESRDWFEENLGEAVSVTETDGEIQTNTRTPVGLALDIWSASRSRLEPLVDSWERIKRCSPETPSLEECEQVIGRYETHKRIDGRVDFVDIIGRYAGVKFSVEGFEEVSPDGEVPDVPVWIFDEQQDTSQLLDRVSRRLVYEGSTRWGYLAGDPFQSIYGWSGADGSLFLKWEADQERITGKSWRCPDSILDLGENCIRECGDYFDRGIKPADHDGEIIITHTQSTEWLDYVKPTESVLCLARTNHLSKWFMQQLNARSIPWESTKGLGSWLPESRRSACLALHSLESGYPIDFREWAQVVKAIPAKDNLVRGTKTKWQNPERPNRDHSDLSCLSDWGATDALNEKVASGEWWSMIADGQRFRDSANRFGVENIIDPTIQIGTIHSVKGAEADTVIMLDSSTRACRENEDIQEGLDEERRLAYVGVTRARKRLVILRKIGEVAHRMPIAY